MAPTGGGRFGALALLAGPGYGPPRLTPGRVVAWVAALYLAGTAALALWGL